MGSPKTEYFILHIDHKPVNNLFIFSSISAQITFNLQFTHRTRVSVTVGRDRKIRIVLRTSQIAGFVTVPS